MPKYLFTASYTAEGIKGLLKDGGSKREAAAISRPTTRSIKLRAANSPLSRNVLRQNHL